MAVPVIPRRSAVTASLATGVAVAALMLLLMPRGAPCTAARCPVAAAAPPVTGDRAAADSFVTGTAGGGAAITTRDLGGRIAEDRVRPSATGFVRPIARVPSAGEVMKLEPFVPPDGRIDTTGHAVSSDQRIAMSLAAANALDSAAAELAMVISTNAEVRAFAETMRRDHGAASIALYEVARRLDATLVPADTSQMRRQAGWELWELSRKSGADFDRAYIAGEVSTHQAALTELDGDLLPSAQNSELRQLLERLRPLVVSHLARAQEIQRGLGDGGR